MIVISNTSPLIFLAKMQRLAVLRQLFEKIYVPKAVYDEILISGKEDSTVKQVNDHVLDSKIEVLMLKMK